MNMDGQAIERLLYTDDREAVEALYAEARRVRDAVYGPRVFMRGLIEVSNHCRNNCLYCGIRRDAHCRRYRLSDEEILDCCRAGHKLGFRTFVLQGGEDGWFGDERVAGLVSRIKDEFTDCAVTLSLGERSRESYARLREAGADRYLLRHETADAAHYAMLHPAEMSFENRMRCLHDLRELGFQVGAGFMVGSPGQTTETLQKDIAFIADFKPEMVGIGPFIPASGTPFGDRPAGSVELTLRLLAIIRIVHPGVLLPATTALGTLDPRGRERGILAGANVVMPNLSPREHRKDYALYDNKLCTGHEAAECRGCLEARVQSTGCRLVVDRGDAVEC